MENQGVYKIECLNRQNTIQLVSPINCVFSCQNLSFFIKNVNVFAIILYEKKCYITCVIYFKSKCPYFCPYSSPTIIRAKITVSIRFQKYLMLFTLFQHCQEQPNRLGHHCEPPGKFSKYVTIIKHVQAKKKVSQGNNMNASFAQTLLMTRQQRQPLENLLYPKEFLQNILRAQLCVTSNKISLPKTLT